MLNHTPNFLILVVVVDNMVIASNSKSLMKQMKSKLTAVFQVKLLGSLRSFIGREILRTPVGTYINQRKYIESFFQSVDLSHVNPQATPIASTADVSSFHASDIALTAFEHARYRAFVGAVMYISVCTRPDVSLATSVLARQMHAPTLRNLVLAKRLVRYLLGTKDLALYYPTDSSAQPLFAFADADWAGCRDTRKSTSGSLVTVNAAVISWSFQRQHIVSLSSAEAEYIALSSCAKSVTWLRRLFAEMVLHRPLETERNLPPTMINSDNTAALTLTTNDQVPEQNKHIELKIHHVRDLRYKHIVEVDYVKSDRQLADMLTKPLTSSKLQFLISHIIVRGPQY